MTALRANGNAKRILAVILGGGRGTRLFPLTQVRCKPAVPLGGRYRLIDIPVSNCINSNLRQVFILTQFNSASLHSHVNSTYQMDVFTGGFVEILAAQQTEVDMSWFEGTADAVRKCRRHLDQEDIERILILSGDQLYRMDFGELVQTHFDSGADATVAAMPVKKEETPSLGTLRVDHTGRIVRFAEKPQDPELQDSLASDPRIFDTHGIAPRGRSHLASMGIYLFEKEVLFDLLDHEEFIDFGHEVFPFAIDKHRVQAHLFDGYWADIGTIGSFYEANLALTDWDPPFNLYEPNAQIFTHARFLPPAKVNAAKITQSIVAEGSIIDDAEIGHSIVGLRTTVRRGVRLQDSIVMGADYYEWERPRRAARGMPPLGIGEGTQIRGAIVDKGVRIGPNCVIENARGVEREDGEHYLIRDGVVVIPKKAVIPAGTVI